MGCEPSSNKKSDGHQRRETQTVTKKKKNDQKKKDPILKKKEKKINLVIAGLDLTGFPKDPEGCPLDHSCVPIEVFHTNFDHLSIHIESSSKIQRTQMTK